MDWGLIGARFSLNSKTFAWYGYQSAVTSGSIGKVKIKRFIYGGMTKDGN
ncbi:hypothetical protein [Pleurocapsa sp. CCALA 161]|nr:hypothetical protein [Pleurocapsa sp. CCALA 161]